MEIDKILATKDVAQILNVSTRTVMRLAGRGELAAFKIGDLWRIKSSDLAEYIERQTRLQHKNKK
ncbi:DNA-binding protein [Ktedonosporobacter rubrisoli]|uniref:DNA-binding protein n=1 Tax=Ktedonosporobacter rubrisoli TaxID=2509675 RepID=A0A4P6K5F6_KTERU|nr:helix-turn-helix domain-containing protein [Ktedonosporobacter rubrisoli]QBD83100.1 DNA-binding protein [Ktedonosporobacter rubrisoli]